PGSAQRNVRHRSRSGKDLVGDRPGGWPDRRGEPRLGHRGPWTTCPGRLEPTPPRRSAMEHDARKAGHAERVDDDRGAPARWKLVGPGIVVAATGVGAADMVATLTAGSRYGYTLLWAVVLGVILKIVLVEGAGRFTLATGYTIFEGWQMLGRWTTFYFGPYIIIWGFVYGATAMSSTALPITALFPDLSQPLVGAAMGLLG